MEKGVEPRGCAVGGGQQVGRSLARQCDYVRTESEAFWQIWKKLPFP